MVSEKSLAWGRSDNVIRVLTAYGLARKAEIGADKVFDFSIGNPSVPAPPAVDTAFARLLQGDSVELHAYTAAPGLMSFRRAIAADLNRRYDAGAEADLVYVTCGASAGLSICTHALMNPGDKAVAFAPFFPEYRVFAECAGGELISVPPAAGLQPDLDALVQRLDEKVTMVIINTPNNPSGVILSAESLTRLSDLLRGAEEKYGHPIYLISDEPYRDLVYDGTSVPCPLHFYDDTILCYSFSKSLSLPGERVGYLAVGSRAADKGDVFAAICGAARSLGYVNAPSLMQRVIESCLDQTADISVYKENRDLLYNGLKELGFDCVYPDGAFYLFVKSPEPDAMAFSERAKKYELLLVPSDAFGVGGYVRLAYCVSTDMIRHSLPAFAALAKEYGL